jgi:predicted DsbA family dithiol-disulfide isomerase
VDVWSDIICPWCYLGERRFERALEQLPWRDEVEVRFRAYQLDPRATAEPGDLRAAIERKYGPGAFDGMTKRLVALGAAEGLDYRFDRALRVNTLDGHRLLLWAGTVGSDAQRTLLHALFRAYFTDGRNVADHDTLVALCGDAGLDEAEARAVLDGDRFATDVRADIDQAMDLGITGVPAFVVEDRVLIPGAQDVDTMVSLLTRVRDRLGAS